MDKDVMTKIFGFAMFEAVTDEKVYYRGPGMDIQLAECLRISVPRRDDRLGCQIFFHRRILSILGERGIAFCKYYTKQM